MGLMTAKQYERVQDAKRAGDKDLMEQIMNEEYGEDSTVVDVEVIELDSDLAADEVAAGKTHKEIAAEYGVTIQKVSALLKKAK